VEESLKSFNKEKANEECDSIETWFFLNALNNTRIDSRYSGFLKHRNNANKNELRYENRQNQIKSRSTSRECSIAKAIHFGPERRLQETSLGTKGNWFLNNLRFADDIVIISSNLGEHTIKLGKENETRRVRLT